MSPSKPESRGERRSAEKGPFSDGNWLTIWIKSYSRSYSEMQPKLFELLIILNKSSLLFLGDCMQKRVLANVSTLIKFQLINFLQKMNEINPLGRVK